MAPEVGFEPTTNRLTADRSTTELLRNLGGPRNYTAKQLIQVQNIADRFQGRNQPPDKRARWKRAPTDAREKLRRPYQSSALFANF